MSEFSRLMADKKNVEQELKNKESTIRSSRKDAYKRGQKWAIRFSNYNQLTAIDELKEEDFKLYWGKLFGLIEKGVKDYPVDIDESYIILNRMRHFLGEIETPQEWKGMFHFDSVDQSLTKISPMVDEFVSGCRSVLSALKNPDSKLAKKLEALSEEIAQDKLKEAVEDARVLQELQKFQHVCSQSLYCWSCAYYGTVGFSGDIDRGSNLARSFAIGVFERYTTNPRHNKMIEEYLYAYLFLSWTCPCCGDTLLSGYADKTRPIRGGGSVLTNRNYMLKFPTLYG